MREIPSFDENKGAWLDHWFQGRGKKEKGEVTSVKHGVITMDSFVFKLNHFLEGELGARLQRLDQSSKSFATCGSFCIFILARGINVSLLV